MATNNGGLSLLQQRQRAAFWFIAPMLAALFFVAVRLRFLFIRLVGGVSHFPSPFAA